MNNVPAYLEEKYVPRLKEQFRKFAEMAEAMEKDPDLAMDESFRAAADGFSDDMNELYADFEKDGGTRAQWNELAPAVQFGKYGPY